MDKKGIRLAALYSLGCPELAELGAETTVEAFVTANEEAPTFQNPADIRNILEKLDPFAFYMLIAAQNGVAISDFLDERVVTAHWLSGEILRPVTRDDITRLFANGKMKAVKDPHKLRQLIIKIQTLKGHVPHHNFCVLQLLAGIKRGVSIPENIFRDMDNCLVSAGKVVSVDSDRIRVEKLSLVQSFPGAVEGKSLICEVGRGFVGEVEPGNFVSVHLGRAREKIGERICDEVTDLTLRAIETFQKGR